MCDDDALEVIRQAERIVWAAGWHVQEQGVLRHAGPGPRPAWNHAPTSSSSSPTTASTSGTCGGKGHPARRTMGGRAEAPGAAGDEARLKLPWRLMASTEWRRWKLMTNFGQAGSGSPFSADGASARVRSHLEASEARFQSILFEQPATGAGVDGLQEPDFFADLNLDQVLESMTVGRKQYDLKPFFYAPLRDVAAVRYRHDVLRDLEKPGVLESVTRFAETMRRMREHLAQVGKLYYPLQKRAWFPGRRRNLLRGGPLARGRARRASPTTAPRW